MIREQAPVFAAICSETAALPGFIGCAIDPQVFILKMGFYISSTDDYFA